MSERDYSFFEIFGLEREREQSGRRYLEFLRVPAMSAGGYVLPAGSADPQKPHTTKTKCTTWSAALVA